jgi:hypothetical protein
MLLRNVALAAILTATGMTAAKAAQPAATYAMEAVGEVQIAKDGHVSDYRLGSKLPEEVAKLVDKDVRSWTFEPILIDGQAVVAKTSMHLRLSAEPVPGDKGSYAMRIVDVRFGEPQRSGQMKPPHYPREAVAARLGARVLLSLHLDQAGNVIEVQPYQTSLAARTRSEREAEEWRHAFERSSMAAAKDWHFDMTETLNGKPRDTTVIVPIVYFTVERLSQANSDGVWRGYVPGPIHPATWVHKEQVADNRDYSDLKDGEALSLDSPFKLKDNVIGKTL